jgi:hypothetical protein
MKIGAFDLQQTALTSPGKGEIKRLAIARLNGGEGIGGAFTGISAARAVTLIKIANSPTLPRNGFLMANP